MTVKQVHFCGELAASALRPNASMAMISIADPGRKAVLHPGWGALLKVAFADASYTHETIAQFGRMWPASSLNFPTKEHAVAIRSFIDCLPPEVDTLHIHCGAGVSRSAAVAKYASERFGLPFPRDYTKYNDVLYQLLRNPTIFDAALAAHCTPKKGVIARFFERP